MDWSHRSPTYTGQGIEEFWVLRYIPHFPTSPPPRIIDTSKLGVATSLTLSDEVFCNSKTIGMGFYTLAKVVSHPPLGWVGNAI